MKITEVNQFPKSNRTAQILTEGYKDLTETQRVYLGRWEKELWPLLEEFKKVSEASLTADEIQAIFQGAEQRSVAGGQNKTALGKVGSAAGAIAKLPVDIAKKVDAKINELGRMAQNAGPVKNMDQKFDELKKKIEAENSDSKIVQGIKKVSDWAKENPGKASIAVGILTTVAAFAGGPMGGAAAGLILRSTKDLLQGEKLSTAVGKSVKTAAYGALAGLAIQGLTDNMVDNIATGSEAEADAMLDGFRKANFQDAVDSATAKAGFDAGVLDGAQNLKMSGNINGFFYNYDVTMTKEQLATYKELTNAYYAADTFSPEYYKAAGELHGWLSTTQDQNESLTALAKTIRNIPRDVLSSDQLEAATAVLDNADEAIEKIIDIGGPAAAAAQGAMQTVDDNAKEKIKAKPIDPKEKEQLELSLKGGEDNPADDKVAVRGTESVSYADAYEHLYEQYLAEAPAATATADAQGELPLNNPNTLGAKAGRGIKGALGAVGGAIKKGASAVGGAVKSTARELGQKITAKKLNSEWEKMGKPTDSGTIYNILSSFGMTDDDIKAVGTEANVKIDSSGPAKPVRTDATPGTTAGQKPADDDTPPGVPSDGTGDAQGGTGDAQGGGDAPKGAPAGQAKDPKNDGPFDMQKQTGTNAGVVSGDFEWKGAQWINNKTGKIADKATAAKLGNPKLAELAREIEKAGVADLVKDQISAPGVKAGTPQAAVAKKVVSKAAQAQGATA
mgnify:FL=1|tara:strand:- start:9401 stop:11596 length:2196 start_codon:yes stop_codon:yes gene_type:complete